MDLIFKVLNIFKFPVSHVLIEYELRNRTSLKRSLT